MAYKRISPQPVVEGGTGASTLTAHGVLIGEGTSAITPTAVGTTGQVLTGVTGADPVWASPAASSISITGDSGGALTGAAFTFTGGTTGLTFAGAGSTETLGGTLAIANGGTNATSMANTDGVVYYDGTRLVTTAVGTATNVLTSNGAGVAPTFQAPAASSISITGNSGGALTGNAFTFTGGTTGLTFAGAGTTETLGGTLAIANGGTNATSMATTDGVVYYDGTRLVTTTAGTSGQVLTSNGAGVAPTYQAAGGGGILSASLALTNSQVKNLAGTPIQIIAAPGAGNVINIVNLSSVMTYGGTNAFTNTSGQPIAAYYGTNTSASNLIFNAVSNSTITATATTWEFSVQHGSPTANIAASIAVNAALVIGVPSASANIAGNAANNNTITIYVLYTII